MKWIVFFAALALTPVLGRWLRMRPKTQPYVWSAIAFLPFFGLDAMKINVVSYELYRGDSRGIEITIVDLLVLALSLALPPPRHPLPYRGAVLAYAAITSLSTFWAVAPLFATFSVWKLMRMILLLRVVSRGCEDVRVAPALLRGMACGIVYELGVALQQRYILHHHQVSASFAHQNTFGMAVNLVVPTMIALVLAKSGGRLALLTIGAGALSIVLTLSRGALMMFGLGALLVFLGSTWRRPTAAKLRTGAIGAAAGAALLAYSWKTIVDRFLHAPKESAEGREQFELAASLMLRDRPLGVGMNGYSLALGDAGYGARAGIYGYDATGIVHNIYWLTAAEIGYLGFVAFVAILAGPPLVALSGAVRARNDIRGDVLLGLAVGLLLMYFQGTLEWAFRQTTLSYMFWIIAGIIASTARAAVGPRVASAPAR